MDKCEMWQDRAGVLLKKNLILIGFMGVGKSTVSEYLGSTLGMDVVEMDQEIEKSQEMSIPDIFDVYGEEYFRSLETDLLIKMQSHENKVVSCGGGVALREENVAEMKKNGYVVLLTASPEVIYERVKDDDNRPVLDGNRTIEFITGLMEKRREKYEAAAEVIINTDNKNTQEICEEIITKVMEKGVN